MTKLFLLLFISVLSLAYGQMAGVLPTSNSETEADWISIVLIIGYFLFLFIIYKNSNGVNDDLSQSRQREELQREMSEKNNIQD